MSVPLGHRNHRSSRGGSEQKISLKHKYGDKSKFKIVKDECVLSADGKQFLFLQEGNYDSYNIPNGVETIEYRALSKANIGILCLPKSFQQINRGAFSGNKYFHVEYNVIKTDNPIHGKLYSLVPKKIIFKNREYRESLFLIISKKRLPKPIIAIMMKENSISVSSFGASTTYDAWGVEYQNDGKELEKAPSEIKKFVIPEGVEKITGIGFNSLEEVTVPKSLKQLCKTNHYYWHKEYSRLKVIRFMGPDSTCTDLLNDRLELIEIPKGSLEHYREQFPEFVDKIVERED